MDAKKWNELRQDKEKAKKMLSELRMSPAYSKEPWGNLSRDEQKKIEKWYEKHGKGWHEDRVPVATKKGIKNKAPKHREAAIKAQHETTLRVPLSHAPWQMTKAELDKHKKPEGTPAAQILTVTEPEEYYFGTEVNVTPEKAWEEAYGGTIVRLLNNGTLTEVRPGGENFKGSSYRIPIERVFVTKVVYNKPAQKEDKPVPSKEPIIAISKSDSTNLKLVGEIKDMGFIALANIVIPGDGRILELPGMNYAKGKEYPLENFVIKPLSQYLRERKENRQAIERKRKEEEEKEKQLQTEVKERLSKPPTEFFTHMKIEDEIHLVPITEKVYPFEYKGISLFAHKKNGSAWDKSTGWSVTERLTGLWVRGGRTKAEAIEAAKELIDDMPGKVKGQIERALIDMGRKGIVVA